MRYPETISICWHSITGEKPEPHRDIIVKGTDANSVWQHCEYIAWENVPDE